MTPEQIQAIREACSSATPGPWRAEARNRYDDDASDGQWGDIDGPNNRSLFTVDMGDFNALTVHDAQFIALARQALPACIEEIERLRGLLGEATCALEARSDRSARLHWAAGLRDAIASNGGGE